MSEGEKFKLGQEEKQKTKMRREKMEEEKEIERSENKEYKR